MLSPMIREPFAENEAIPVEVGEPDIVCLSHLRWQFVFQRPQHLMTQLARRHRVFFVEEPRFEDQPDHLSVSEVQGGVRVVVPVLDRWRAEHPEQLAVVQRSLLDRLLRREEIDSYVLWYYTPMALPFTRQLAPQAIVYDCMDELSGFAGAPLELKNLERELLACADLVTTGGRSLFEAKRSLHHNVHPFPSSVDAPHFARARAGVGGGGSEPPDQVAIPRPRIGFAGVIDERMDLSLLTRLALQRPDWQLVLLGPVAKVDPATLPRLQNVHYLGMKPYAELPDYMAGWDVGILPFAHNDATRFISPTKTPEYLAAGLPVVATSIRDVVEPYGTSGLARIADGAAEFAAAIEAALGEGRCPRLNEVDELLGRGSWEHTAAAIRQLMLRAVTTRAMRTEPCAAGAFGPEEQP
jgi:glycosyltransferase involved in cell wall biosynthesis